MLCLAPATLAAAETMEDVQARLQEATSAYYEAEERIAEIEGQISENEARIAEIEAALPEQRAAAASSIRTEYKMQQDVHGLIELILSSKNFFEFIESIQYLDKIQERNTQTIDKLIELDRELEERRASLAQERTKAIEERDAAQQAIDDAEAAREELERIAAEEAAREEAERQAALAEAAAKAAAQETFTNASGNEVSYEIAVPDEEETKRLEEEAERQRQLEELKKQQEAEAQRQAEEEAKRQAEEAARIQAEEEAKKQAEEEAKKQAEQEQQTYSQRDIFVNTWKQRIDAYLAGTPLSGYGYAFAEAAWDYGVDPRYSPAISYVESSCGAYCFRSHNAWGWGSSSWDDWDTAIRAHVSGLSAGYGYTLTYAGAQKYCPPGDAWYSAVDTQMKRIWPTDQL